MKTDVLVTVLLPTLHFSNAHKEKKKQRASRPYPAWTIGGPGGCWVEGLLGCLLKGDPLKIWDRVNGQLDSLGGALRVEL